MKGLKFFSIDICNSLSIDFLQLFKFLVEGTDDGIIILVDLKFESVELTCQFLVLLNELLSFLFGLLLGLRFLDGLRDETLDL